MAKRTTKNYPRDMEDRRGKVVQEIRKDIPRIEDPKGQAPFETAAEVITGLKTAFEHYESKSEKAWKQPCRTQADVAVRQPHAVIQRAVPKRSEIACTL